MFGPEAVDPAVDFLAALAGDGRRRSSSGSAPAGSRCRSPRAACRCTASTSREAMVARLRAKPGGDAHRRSRSATSRRPGSTGTFTLAYLVFNTINNLTTQDAQVACFRNAAAHLEPGGCFVIEVGVPELQRLPPGETFRPFDVEPDAPRLRRVRRRDQGLISHHYSVVDGRLGASTRSRSATSGRPSST